MHAPGSHPHSLCSEHAAVSCTCVPVAYASQVTLCPLLLNVAHPLLLNVAHAPSMGILLGGFTLRSFNKCWSGPRQQIESAI